MASGVGGGRDLHAYVAAVASGEPTPGGGSVVAVVAALGAALARMVGNLTLGREGRAEAAVELEPVLARVADLQARLLRLAEADEEAYGDYIAATGLPKQTEAERATRRAAMQAALGEAAVVPLAVAEGCADLAEAIEPVARLGNRRLLPDVAIGAHLTRAALRGSLLNVRGNARLLSDEGRASDLLSRADDVERRGESAIDRALSTVADRGA